MSWHVGLRMTRLAMVALAVAGCGDPTTRIWAQSSAHGDVLVQVLGDAPDGGQELRANVLLEAGRTGQVLLLTGSGDLLVRAVRPSGCAVLDVAWARAGRTWSVVVDEASRASLVEVPDPEREPEAALEVLPASRLCAPSS